MVLWRIVRLLLWRNKLAPLHAFLPPREVPCDFSCRCRTQALHAPHRVWESRSRGNLDLDGPRASLASGILLLDAAIGLRQEKLLHAHLGRALISVRPRSLRLLTTGSWSCHRGWALQLLTDWTDADAVSLFIPQKQRDKIKSLSLELVSSSFVSY